MKKWSVTARGTLKFDREIVLFAKSEEEAAEAAEAIVKDAMRKSDEVDIDELYAEEFEPDDGSVKYEVGYYFMKDEKETK